MTIMAMITIMMTIMVIIAQRRENVAPYPSFPGFWRWRAGVKTTS